MKQILVSFTIILILLGGEKNVFSQKSIGGLPHGLEIKAGRSAVKSKSKIKSYSMPSFDKVKMLEEDKERGQKGFPYRFAKPFLVNYDIKKMGTFELADNGDKVWRMNVKSKGAYSINIIFKKYKLPDNAKLYIYNADGSQIIGGFTNSNNINGGSFATEPVKGDEVIIEYSEPTNPEFEGELVIGQISHDYKDVFKFISTTGLDDSDTCNIDINCPEGADWQDEKHAVCRILIDGSSGCSGSLLNNIRKDGMPYFITANHCLDNGNTSANTIVFYFNYEKPGCNSGTPSIQTRSGSQLKANRSTGDWALVRMDALPPKEYTPYFAGWYNVDNPATNSVCIHHPRFDVKKISIEDDPANHYGTYKWSVTFDEGAIEHGSSGSPLFNQDHKVVGVASTSTVGCAPVWTSYGKISKAWNTVSSHDEQLKEWLDPDNSNKTTMDGMYYCDDGPESLVLIGGQTGIKSYFAQRLITSTQRIYLGADIRYKSGDNIILGTGFRVYSEAEFLAYLDECIIYNPSLPLRSAQPDNIKENEIIENEGNISENINVEIYPNPNDGNFYFDIENMKDYNTCNISIYDCFGKKVYTRNNIIESAGEVNLWGLEGIYFLHLQIDGKLYSKKLIITR